MKFIKLTHDSSIEEAKTYLVQLARSPYHYHIDDDLTEDFSWGCTPPDPETLKVMQSNIDIVYDMEGLTWHEAWDVYHDAWKDHENKQTTDNA